MVKRLEQKKDPLETVIFQCFKNSTKLFREVFVIIFHNMCFCVVKQVFDKEIQLIFFSSASKQFLFSVCAGCKCQYYGFGED